MHACSTFIAFIKLTLILYNVFQHGKKKLDKNDGYCLTVSALEASIYLKF